MKELNKEMVLLGNSIPKSTSCDDLTSVDKDKIPMVVKCFQNLVHKLESNRNSSIKEEDVIVLEGEDESQTNSSTPNKTDYRECLQKRLTLRPRKTELIHVNETKKPRNDKTEKKDPIEKSIFEVADESLDLTLEVDSSTEVDVFEAKNQSILNLENDRGSSSEFLSVLKSDDSKSKDNSESDAKVSSASEYSVIKSVKKKKRRRDLKWSGKRKKRNKGGGKAELKLQPAIAFDWQDVGNSSPANENPQKKGREFAIPSPSLADISMKPAIPESTATSLEVAKPSLCLCRKKPNVFVSGNYNIEELHCQALDCIDNRIVSCCNAIPTQHVGLFRASERVPYQMMCDVHQQRLCRHNCCPGCGLFCTQGKYLMCRSFHHFHKACTGDLVPNSCLHCGDDTPPKFVTVTFNSQKNSLSMPQGLTGSARISKESYMNLFRDDEEQDFNFPPAVLNLGLHLSHTNGLISGLHRDKFTYKSLYAAAQSGDAEKIIKIIACGFNPNYVFEENNQQTALHVAAANGHLPVVHILLQAKVQVNIMDAEQNTPLTAAIVGGQNDVVRYLIKCGADLLVKSEDGMTPLHVAAKSGNVGACCHLLNGTHVPLKYVDSLDDGGWTPLVWAAEFNQLETVKLLLSKGADPFIKDAEQNVALHWAAFGGSIDIIELFLNDGSDINAVNVHGDTPLHIAARQNKYNCVLLLLARGAKSDIINNSGELPRSCAESQTSDVYKAITLNMEINSLVSKFQDRAPRIISNDISRGKEKNQIQCVNGVDDEDEPRDFVYVTESCFTSKISIDRTITLLQSCSCSNNCESDLCNCAIISVSHWYDNEGKLKPEFKYSNPPTIFECNQLCMCNRITCRNRVVQNGISCRFQLFRTENRGWGIRALNLIPKGTYVCEYIGEIISDSEADEREDDSYLFDLDNRDGETYCIDARKYGNFARFINHLCNANLTPIHVFVEHQDVRFPRIAFFANKDIQPNEELGYNYGEKFWVIKWNSFTCTCGAENCMYSERTVRTTLDKYRKKLEETT